MNINEFRITYALLTYLCKVKRWNNIDHQEHLLCVKHWFQELDNPQAAVGPSQAFADTPIGPSLLKLDESQRKRLESLFNTAYSVVKAGKPFSDYELICEIQVKMDLTWVKTIEILMVVKLLLHQLRKISNFILQIGTWQITDRTWVKKV